MAGLSKKHLLKMFRIGGDNHEICQGRSGTRGLGIIEV